MNISKFNEELDNLTKSDIIRLYLCISIKYNSLKSENPKSFSKLLYAVKNPDKLKYHDKKRTRNKSIVLC